MAGIGHPIVGDHRYGLKDHVLKGKGLFLAAVELTFTHPITDQKMEVSIEVPPKFTTLLQREKRRWTTFNGGAKSNS
jgi:23S rRNA pseudouridine1911/1915/1917 synthase